MGTTVTDNPTKNVCACGHLEFAHGDNDNRPCYGVTEDGGKCQCGGYHRIATHRSEIPQPLPPVPDPRTCRCGHTPDAHTDDDAQSCLAARCPCGTYIAVGKPCGLCGHAEVAHRALCQATIVAEGIAYGRCSCLAYVHPDTRCEACNHRLSEHGQGRDCEVGNDECGCGCDRFTVLIDAPESELARGGIFRAIRGSDRPESRSASTLPNPAAIARYAAELMGEFAAHGIRHDIAVQLTAAVVASRGPR